METFSFRLLLAGLSLLLWPISGHSPVLADLPNVRSPIETHASNAASPSTTGHAENEGRSVLAEVGDLKIDRTALDAEYALQLGSGPIAFALKYRDRLTRQLLQQMIDRKLLLREAESAVGSKARAEALRPDDIAVDRALRYKRGNERQAERFDRLIRLLNLTDSDLRGPLRERIVVERFLNEVIAQAYLASDEEMKRELRENGDRYREVEERRVRQILIPLNAEDPPAEVERWEQLGVQIRALSETADFAQLAKRYATKASRPKGGDIGWVTRGQFEAAFSDVVFTLQPMVVSAPFRTREGINLVRVEEIRGGKMPTEEQLRGRLSAEIIARKRASALAELLLTARRKTKVLVYYK